MCLALELQREHELFHALFSSRWLHRSVANRPYMNRRLTEATGNRWNRAYWTKVPFAPAGRFVPFTEVMKILVLVLTLGAAALLVGGCASSSAPKPASALPLAGTSWRLVELEGKPVPATE